MSRRLGAPVNQVIEIQCNVPDASGIVAQEVVNSAASYRC